MDGAVCWGERIFSVKETLNEITGNYLLVFSGWHYTCRPMSERTVNLVLRTIGFKHR
tara:strand:+ start:974 stop:1144 length:171 start_codon:yes stop_codon:yes gene_type:complete